MTLYLPGFLDHCLLWPSPLTHWPQNLTSTSTNQSTPVTKIWLNFEFAGHCLLRPWPLTFWSQNLSGTSMSPSTSVTKKWVKFHSSVFEIWCSQSFREAQTRRLTQTYSRMDTPEDIIPPAPKVFGGWCIKKSVALTEERSRCAADKANFELSSSSSSSSSYIIYYKVDRCTSLHALRSWWQ